jgi:hypothetical protein
LSSQDCGILEFGYPPGDIGGQLFVETAGPRALLEDLDGVHVKVQDTRGDGRLRVVA